jgi:hypothetical protein
MSSTSLPLEYLEKLQDGKDNVIHIAETGCLSLLGMVHTTCRHTESDEIANYSTLTK